MGMGERSMLGGGGGGCGWWNLSPQGFLFVVFFLIKKGRWTGFNRPSDIK